MNLQAIELLKETGVTLEDAAAGLKRLADLLSMPEPEPLKPLDKLFIVFNADGSIFATLQDEDRAIEFESAELGRVYYEYELA